MKAKVVWQFKFVLLGLAVAVVTGCFVFLNARSSANPELLFKGYSTEATSGKQVASFELRDPSGRTIWLCCSGREFPLRPPFLERPLAPTTADARQTNVYSLSVGSFFMQGQKLLPGQTLLLKFPLSPGRPAMHVGVDYYVGIFKDGNDFLDNLGRRILGQNANLKDQAVFYWENAKRRFRAPKRCEVWCLEPVCFQTTSPNPATASRAEGAALSL